MSERPDAMTVYYDGECPLCRAEIGHYRACRGADAVSFVDVSKPDADPGPDLPREAAMARFHVRDAEGRLVSGAAGFAALWSVLPAWRPAARIGPPPGGVRGGARARLSRSSCRCGRSWRGWWGGSSKR